MNRLKQLWSNLRSSLWFVPVLIVVCSVGLAVGFIEVDGRINRELLAEYPRVFGAGADGSRGMLSAIAGSMITVAGLTFSLTRLASERNCIVRMERGLGAFVVKNSPLVSVACQGTGGGAPDEAMLEDVRRRFPKSTRAYSALDEIADLINSVSGSYQNSGRCPTSVVQIGEVIKAIFGRAA